MLALIFLNQTSKQKILKIIPKTTVQNSHLEEIKTHHNEMCLIENLQRQTQRCDTKIYIKYIVVLRSVGNYIIIANLSRANLVCDNFLLGRRHSEENYSDGWKPWIQLQNWPLNGGLSWVNLISQQSLSSIFTDIHITTFLTPLYIRGLYWNISDQWFGMKCFTLPRSILSLWASLFKHQYFQVPNTIKMSWKESIGSFF